MKKIFEKIKNMHIIKKVLLALLAIIVVLLLINIKLVTYGVQQGLGQLEMVRNAVPIDTLLNDKNYPDSLKAKLLIIKQVREFAIENLGLKDSPNYQAVYDLKGRPTAYVVQACEKYRVKKHLWKFPIVGSLPYKGFFDEEDAKKECQLLEEQGFDVRISHPSGWSTMGYFKDPILSSMLKRDEANLAELIIHELTHSTIFVKDDSELNENIADYVGENGAIRYLLTYYGPTSDKVSNYVNQISDNEKLANYFLASAKQLDSMYCTDEFVKLPDSLKNIRKHDFIQQIVNNIDSLGFQTINVQRLKDGRLKNINNTFFTSYMTYYNRKDKLRCQLKEEFDSDFMKHLEYLKKEYGR